MELTWNVRQLADEKGKGLTDLVEETGLKHHILKALYTNTSMSVGLDVVSTLCRYFGVHLGPSVFGTATPVHLFEWTDHGFVFRFQDVITNKGLSINELHFRTGINRSTLAYLLNPTIERQKVQLKTVALLARYLEATIGVYPGASDQRYLLSWCDKRIPYREPEPDYSPIPGQPSKICTGPVCLQENPHGVEKRLDAFRHSPRFKYGRAPECNKCHAFRERTQRHNRKKRRQAVSS